MKFSETDIESLKSRLESLEEELGETEKLTAAAVTRLATKQASHLQTIQHLGLSLPPTILMHLNMFNILILSYLLSRCPFLPILNFELSYCANYYC